MAKNWFSDNTFDFWLTPCFSNGEVLVLVLVILMRLVRVSFLGGKEVAVVIIFGYLS
jgi:hypothetical protein